jgi:hypothetical protein
MITRWPVIAGPGWCVVTGQLILGPATEKRAVVHIRQQKST